MIDYIAMLDFFCTNIIFYIIYSYTISRWFYATSAAAMNYFSNEVFY